MAAKRVGAGNMVGGESAAQRKKARDEANSPALKEHLEQVLRRPPGEQTPDACADKAEAATMALVQRAVAGDVRAFHEIREMRGETKDEERSGRIVILDDLGRN